MDWCFPLAKTKGICKGKEWKLGLEVALAYSHLQTECWWYYYDYYDYDEENVIKPTPALLIRNLQNFDQNLGNS